VCPLHIFTFFARDPAAQMLPTSEPRTGTSI
jgi:hypothetical protein